MRLSAQGDETVRPGVLERVIKQVHHALLHFLIIKSKQGQLGADFDVQTHACTLIRLVPAAGQIIDAIPKIILVELKDELSAFQSRIVEEHGNETYQPVAAFF